MGILDAMLGRREPAVQYRTVDGGHPAPYPDMTDEQLYNYELAFNIPNKTFDRPPRARSAPYEAVSDAAPRTGTGRYRARAQPQAAPAEPTLDEPSLAEPAVDAAAEEDERNGRLQAGNKIVPPEAGPPLDFNRPLRTVTTRHPVEIITTRARHPVYKVHGYIGDDDVVTVFTIDGRLSEHGPRFIENVPQKERLFLNVYPNPDTDGERFVLTQHATQAAADAQARPGRIACVPLEFNL